MEGDRLMTVAQSLDHFVVLADELIVARRIRRKNSALPGSRAAMVWTCANKKEPRCIFLQIGGRRTSVYLETKNVHRTTRAPGGSEELERLGVRFDGPI
jgi:hypothetical protein